MAFTLPSELGTIEELIKRFERAEQARRPYEGFLTEAFRYVAPYRQTFTKLSAGVNRNKYIFDDTATIAAERYVSRLQSMLMPSWQEWSRLRPGADYEKSPQADTIAEALDKITDDLFRYINHSNFYQVLPEALLDLSVTTGVLKIEAGDIFQPFRTTAESIANVWFEEGPGGTLENTWRKPSIAFSLIERLYDGAELSQATKDKAKDKPDYKPELIEGTVYMAEQDEYHSFLIEKAEKHLAWAQNLGSGPGANPWVAFRSRKTPNEILGNGPGMTALSSIKTANKMVEFELRNAALASAGAWTSTSDGVMNPYTAVIAPGSIIPVGSNARQNPTLAPLERSGDFNVMNLVLADIRESIKMTFLNALRKADGPVRSATEIAIEDRDLLMDEGAAFGRLNTELVDRTVTRKVRIMSELGLIPRLTIDGREVTLKHTSPLSRAQDQSDLIALEQYFQIGNNSIGPELMALGTRVEEVPEFIAKRTGLPQELIRPEDERAQIQETMAAAAAQAQTAEGAAQ